MLQYAYPNAHVQDLFETRDAAIAEQAENLLEILR